MFTYDRDILHVVASKIILSQEVYGFVFHYGIQIPLGAILFYGGIVIPHALVSRTYDIVTIFIIADKLMSEMEEGLVILAEQLVEIRGFCHCACKVKRFCLE